jgi:hypothetical protein
MQIKGAMTVLNKRCDFYGWTFDQLITKLDEGFDENYTVLTAYEVYKQHNGYVWCGLNGVGWTTPEKSREVEEFGEALK